MKDTTLVIVVVIQLLICQWYVVIIRIEHFLNLCNFSTIGVTTLSINALPVGSVVRAAGPAGVVVGVVGAAGVVGSVGVGVGAGVIFALFV